MLVHKITVLKILYFLVVINVVENKERESKRMGKKKILENELL